MKKILGIMLVGALIAGVAFADVSFTYTGTAILGGTGKAINTATRNDCFNLGFGDQANGAVIDWDIASGALSLDSYYGWMTFGLPVGSLQVTTGKWASRYVNRVNQDAGDLDGEYYEAFKPGVIIGVASYVPATNTITAGTGTFANDIDNLTAKKMGTVLGYTLDNVLPGKFMAKFGLVNDDGTYNEDSGDEVTIHSGFVGEVAYEQDKVVKLNFALKNYNEKQYGFGLFVSPLMLDKLSATAGFSMGMYNQKDTADYSEWGVDFRARYAITDKVAVTTMNNISGYKITPDAKDSVDDKAMWNMVSVSAKAGDNINFKATVQNTNSSFKAVKLVSNVFALTPVCEIQASAKAKVTAGFDIRWTNAAPFAGTGTVRLPIYFSFAL
jgi:hypothetical protein